MFLMTCMAGAQRSWRACWPGGSREPSRVSGLWLLGQGILKGSGERAGSVVKSYGQELGPRWCGASTLQIIVSNLIPK